jgi:hypothetical protein
MTDKRIMTHHEKQFLQHFKNECASASRDNYNNYVGSEADKPTSYSINFLGNMYKLLAEYYGAIHNCNKMESIFYYKLIEKEQNDILNKLIFDCNDWPAGSFLSMSATDRTDCVEGHTETVRQAGEIFKHHMKSVKETMYYAINLDNDFGYWV